MRWQAMVVILFGAILLIVGWRGTHNNIAAVFGAQVGTGLAEGKRVTTTTTNVPTNKPIPLNLFTQG